MERAVVKMLLKIVVLGCWVFGATGYGQVGGGRSADSEISMMNTVYWGEMIP